MKNNPIEKILHLFYPELCIGCEHQLLDGEKHLCLACQHDLPIIHLTDFKSNPITNTFYGRIPVALGFSLLYFRREGVVKQLIHQLKYKGNESIGTWFGTWIGHLLKDDNQFSQIDCIVPVPLHAKKMKQRGHNQVSKFSKALSTVLQTPISEDALVRISSTKTQTFKARFERFSNMHTKFALKNGTPFRNQHVLIVDDVLTTGATLEACAKEFLKIEGCQVSVLTMAYTE
ncbi:MAG: amidophosphoribosyltransferase [Flavobacteriaceae bacterium]|nr:amidophosphoribosyltransferase [Flavobacteriaceae bacterium]|tara:strand:+ start:102031 stop:102723 length:693 start_codon:yes stop_codon:yes gene_type:complete